MAVQCTPVKCEAHRPPPECSQAGFVSMSRPQANNPCCSETLCGEPRAPAAGRVGAGGEG